VIGGQAGAIGRSGRISETKVPVQVAGAPSAGAGWGAKVLAWRG